MKKLFISIISVCLTSVAGAFQTENAAYGLLEAGRATDSNVPAAIYLLGEGKYEEALTHAQEPWLKAYLTDLIAVTAPLKRFESEHFVLYTPPHQTFLKEYALPALEKTAEHLNVLFAHRPKGKIRVEIYANKEDFSKASTLSLETLERSGAIGICKFHRLMIMSPQSLPLGYRWLDALSHEYLHLNINELTDSKAELWLHEGTARYFETSYRFKTPEFLTPHQQTQLLDALEKGTLVSFARMSPSMVYLKDQTEVSLAFAQVSYAVSILLKEGGVKKFVSFLMSLKKEPFQKTFQGKYGKTVLEFEENLKSALAREKWEKSKGTLSDEIRFTAIQEDDVVGADVQGRMRLGDRMRQRGHFAAALIEYEKALKEEPDNAVLLLKAARAHLELNETEQALQKLRRATSKNPNYITPHIELAKLTEPSEALEHLEEALAMNPFDPTIHKLLADVYIRLDKKSDAERELRIAGELIRE